MSGFRWLCWIVVTVLLAGCTGIPKGVTPVDDFNVARFEGTWYEIMRLDHRFERGLSDVSATYTLRPDGTVDVFNRGFDVDDCRWKAVNGRARFQGEATTASLSVTFFWPISGGYHVIALDRDDYQWAMVSGPTRGYLWILARTPSIPTELRQRLIDKARGLDFPVEDLILVDHGAETACDP